MTRLAHLHQIVQLNATALAARIGTAEHHMRAICADGYPGGHEGGRPDDVTWTTTEAAVVARQRVTADHAALEAALRTIGELLGRCVNICDGYPGVGFDLSALKAKLRCADPVCEKQAVKDGLCQSHYMRAWRAKGGAA